MPPAGFIWVERLAERDLVERIDNPVVVVSIFGAVLGPMFDIMVADYYPVKRQVVVVDDLYTISPKGSFHYDGGWNRRR